MDYKALIGIMNRPWLFEPLQAKYWGGVVNNIIAGGAMPAVDKRVLDSGYFGDTPVFRVDEKGNVDTNGAIQVFRMTGPVAKYDYCGALGTQTWIQHFNAAFADPTVKGIVVWGDSPGGQVDGTETLANTIAAKNKPVIGYTDGMICSAAYWFFSAMDLIVVSGENNGWTVTMGSIGTMAIYTDDSEKMAKDGIKQIVIYAEDSTDKNSTYKSILEGDFTRIKQELKGINDVFKAAVTTNRGDKLNLDKENVLTGKTYNAKEAIKAGLADIIGTFTDAVRRASILSKQQQNSSSMPKLAFQNVLTVAAAASFQVVDNGFLMTEEQLNAVDTQLAANNTTIRTLSAQISAPVDVEAVQKTANDLILAQSELTTLKATLQDKTTALTAAEAKIAQMEANPGGFFKSANKNQDPEQANERQTDAQAILDSLPHNQAADQKLKGVNASAKK